MEQEQTKTEVFAGTHRENVSSCSAVKQCELTPDLNDTYLDSISCIGCKNVPWEGLPCVAVRLRDRGRASPEGKRAPVIPRPWRCDAPSDVLGLDGK